MSARRAGAIAAVLLAGEAALAQYGPSVGELVPNNYPPPLPERAGPAPKLRFELLGEIPVEGPVARAEAWAEGDEVIVPLEAGGARVVPQPGALPEAIVGPVPPPETGDRWVMNAEGTRRYRTTAEGIVEAEKRGKPGRRWKRSWKIVAPNATPAPPLLVGPRLCYAGLDDRVTCVKAKNGHRLWTTDLGDRLSRSIARWPSARADRVTPTPRDRYVEGEILLAVPDDGASMLALDAYDGRQVAVYELDRSARLVSGPLVFGDDDIVAVREAFDKRDVAVLVLRLVHNDAPPAPTSPTGR